MKWKAAIGSFKISREKDTNALFYFILIDCYSVYNACRVLQWQGLVVVISRTWVRSQVPPFPYIFPLIIILCSFNTGSQPCNSPSSLPRICQDQSEGHSLRNIVDMSQHLHTLAREVKKGLKTLGQNCYNTPLNWGQTPLGLQHLFYFILFFIFQLFLFFLI